MNSCANCGMPIVTWNGEPRHTAANPRSPFKWRYCDTVRPDLGRRTDLVATVPEVSDDDDFLDTRPTDDPDVETRLRDFVGKTISQVDVFAVKDKVQLGFTDGSWIQFAGGAIPDVLAVSLADHV